MKQPSLFLFSPDLFDKVKKDFARLEKEKERNDKQEIQHLNNRITGYKGVITKLKKVGLCGQKQSL